jgi:hypothetical protein
VLLRQCPHLPQQSSQRWKRFHIRCFGHERDRERRFFFVTYPPRMKK